MEWISTAKDNFVAIEQPVVLALGAFDGIHIGHRATILLAKNEAQRLGAATVVYSFWPHPSLVLNAPKQLILTRSQKRERLKLLDVDYFVEQCFNETFAEIRAKDFILLLERKFRSLVAIAVGENFRFGKSGEGDPFFLKTLNRPFEVGVQPFVLFGNQRVSSSSIRRCLSDGHIDRANRMLGYPYYLLGTVYKGRGLGKKLGYPTLNVHFENDLLLKFGVYLVRYRFDGEGEYEWGVANFGVRPTFFEGVPEVTLEVHSLDIFFPHLMGEHVEVQFWSYIREEKRFASQALLVEQIRHDIKVAKARMDHLL
jgi:riboflavin kinase/FMN adenylyltransferase